MPKPRTLPYGFKCPLCQNWKTEFIESTEATTKGRILNCTDCEKVPTRPQGEMAVITAARVHPN